MVGCNNTSFSFAKLQKTMNSRKRFKEKKQKNLFCICGLKAVFFICLSMLILPLND